MFEMEWWWWGGGGRDRRSHLRQLKGEGVNAGLFAQTLVLFVLLWLEHVYAVISEIKQTKREMLSNEPVF